ncbi:hypothetical protein ALMP_52920 [Streptomyces sp. A012304]|nr:hypothetical protein ALMP_52920 [Streptomyces sp. A012304]
MVLLAGRALPVAGSGMSVLLSLPAESRVYVAPFAPQVSDTAADAGAEGSAPVSGSTVVRAVARAVAEMTARAEIRFMAWTLSVRR